MSEADSPTTPRAAHDDCPHQPSMTTRRTHRSASRVSSRCAPDGIPPCHRNRAESAVDTGEELDKDLARLTSKIHNLEKRAKKAALEARIRELEEHPDPWTSPIAYHRRADTFARSPSPQPRPARADLRAFTPCWTCGSPSHMKKDCHKLRNPDKRNLSPVPILEEDLYPGVKHRRLHPPDRPTRPAKANAYYHRTVDPPSVRSRDDVAHRTQPIRRLAVAILNPYPATRSPLPHTQRSTVGTEYLAHDHRTHRVRRNRRRATNQAPFLHPNHPDRFLPLGRDLN